MYTPQDKLIMVVNYPINPGDQVKYVSGFMPTVRGGCQPNFTTDPMMAQRFGIEAYIHQRWLTEMTEYDNAGNINTGYCVVGVPEVPTVLFDDQKDYSTVDIAVQISSSLEVSALYSQFKEKGLDYKQDQGGNMITVGKLNGCDISIAPVIHEVSGVRILYVEATSDVICWSMIEEWVKAKVGKEIQIVTNPANLISMYNSFVYERDQLGKKS